MRMIFVFVVIIFVVAAKAQTVLPGSYLNYTTGDAIRNAPVFDSSYHKKWSFSKYADISVGYSFFKGGSASVFAAPVGIQINRRLNNNLYAFTGVSVAPAYINFNNAFLSSNPGKINGNNLSFNNNNLSLSSRAELGLMYINNEKTFSISGSIGVERNSYPVFYNQTNTSRSNTAIFPNK